MAENAKVVFKRGAIANLPAEIADGAVYVTTDECGMYVDAEGKRIRIGDFHEFNTLTDLRANANPSAVALYYVTELNCLAKWDGEKYVQINLDTGATNVEIVGDGNAVTAAVYDPATRKITLTAGASYTTSTDVENQIAEKLGDLSGVGAQIATLIGEDAGKSARTIANEELSKQLIPENAQESLDTLAEIAAWIQEHPRSASNINKAIKDLKALVGTLPDNAESATVVAYIKEAVDGAIGALSIDDYAKTTELTAAVERIAALEPDSHTHANKTVLDSVTAEQNAKNYIDAAMTWGTF